MATPIDTTTRSWVKSAIWRVIGVFLLGGLAWMITGDWAATTTITVLFHSIRVVMYYYFERAWENIAWGRLPVVVVEPEVAVDVPTTG